MNLVPLPCQEIGAHQLAIRPERRRQFMGELISRAPDVMSLLAACAAQAQANQQVLESVRRICFTLGWHEMKGIDVGTACGEEIMVRWRS